MTKEVGLEASISLLADDKTDSTYLFHDTKDGEEATGDTEGNKMSCDVFNLNTLCMVVIFSAISVCCAQALGGLIPEFELNMWRFLAHLLIVSSVAIVRKIPVIPSREDVPWIGIICLMYNFYNIFYYTSTIHLPLGTIAGVSRGLTLLIVSAVTMYKERTFSLTLSCGLCILGMLFMSQPAFIFRDLIENINENHTLRPLCHKRCDDNDLFYNVSTRNTSASSIKQSNQVVSKEGIGYILVLLASCAICIIYFTRSKKVPSVNCVVINFWVGVCGLIVSFVFMLIFEDFILPCSTTCILLLCGHAIGASLSTSATQLVLQQINPIVLTLFTCLQLVLLGIAQYTFMRNINPGKGNAVEVLGMVTVCVGNLVGPVYRYCSQS